MNERRKAERLVSPAITEYAAIAECARLRAAIVDCVPGIHPGYGAGDRAIGFMDGWNAARQFVIERIAKADIRATVTDIHALIEERDALRAAMERIFADNGLNSENRAQALDALHGAEMDAGFGSALDIMPAIVADRNVDAQFRAILAGEKVGR